MLDDSYGSGDKPEYAVVATQPWVMEILENDIWPRIRRVNNLAATALEKANQALTNANKGITLANSAIKKSVKEVQLNLENGPGIYELKLKTILNNGTEIVSSNQVKMASEFHYHAIEYSYEKGVFKFAPTTRQATKESDVLTRTVADLSSVPNNLQGNSSTGELSWTTLGGTSGNFNIADTIFFKQRAYGSVSKGSGGATVNFAMDADWSGTGRLGLSRVLDLNVMAIDGTTILQTIHVATDGVDAYDAGYEAGWKAAAEGSGRSGNTVTYPKSTVGEFSSQTAEAISDCSHRFGWYADDEITYRRKTYYRGIHSDCNVNHDAYVSWS